jgi:predicted RNA binding protein YcfA (HicA-like mRNA interferase family)
MRIPKDLSGEDLIKKLKIYGYEVTRQTGSHIRLVTDKKGKHQITIPAHKNLRIGTLSSVIRSVAQHFDK